MTQRAHQRTAVLAATVGSSLMIAQQVASRATRDALFLTAYSVRVLPLMVLTGAALSLVSVLFATRAMARFGPARVAPYAFALNAALFLVDYVLAHVAAKAGAIVLYLHIALLGATVISIFWSLISERFDPHTCKKYIGRIGAGGTLGGIAGGLLAWNASVLLSVRSNLAIMGGLNIVCALAAMRVANRERVVVADDEPSEPTVAVLRSSRYLRLLATVVLAVAISEALLDYVFNSAAAARYRSGHDLIRFFAIFHTATALVTFVLQMGLAQRALARLGPGGVIAALPISVIIGGLFGFGSPTLVRLVGLRGAEAAISNSLFRSGYELFYAPVAADKKRSTKTAIDVGFDRVGTFVGGGVTILVLHLTTTRSVELLLAIAVALGIFLLYLARLLSRAYVAALAESLRDESPLVVRAPRITDGATVGHVAPLTALVDHQKIVGDVEALVSGDPAAVLAVLSRAPFDVRLVPHVIPLLAVYEVADAAHSALRSVAAHIVGAIGDALLDPGTALDARRRLPMVLRAASGQRTCDVLVATLRDPSFDVRYHAAIALARVTRRGVPLRVDETVIFDAVLRAVETDKSTWESRLELEPEDEGDEFAPMDAYLRLKTSRGMQLIFALLSVVLDREPIQLAFAALSTDDNELRGTALEYLENVLPDDVRDGLWPYLGDRRAFRSQRRERTEVIQKLVNSGEAITSILHAMREDHRVG